VTVHWVLQDMDSQVMSAVPSDLHSVPASSKSFKQPVAQLLSPQLHADAHET
jgi:hypothetical protein